MMHITIVFNIYNNQNSPKTATNITFANLYNEWLNEHIQYIHPSKSTISSYKNSFRHCEQIHHSQIKEIKYKDYQTIIDSMRNNGLSYASAKKVKSLISLVEKYGLRTDLIEKAYAPLLVVGKNKKRYPHQAFTRRKINQLWEISDVPFVDTALVLLYTGMRVGELLGLKKKDVNLKQKTIRITHAKTASGVRIIPIHSRIYSFIETRMRTSGLYLIEEEGAPLPYSKYRRKWDYIMNLVHCNHRPHDTRHTFASMLDAVDANPNAKRRLLGHSTGDVTDRVYTHKTLRQLRKTIQLLK